MTTLMTLKEIKETIIRGDPALKFPLRIDYGRITDANGHMILQMRGWGYIQYADKGAEEIQDSIAQWVVDTLNAENERNL